MRNKNNVSDKVYNYILTKIKSKEWLPGSKIMTENELCKELDVSRVAVRQAIGRLSALGLLKQKQGSGTFVANIDTATLMNSLMSMFLLDTEDILSILEFRIYFEYGNVKMFMKNHTEEDIEKLEYYYNQMMTNTDDVETFYMADFNFHNVIAKGTKNPIVIKVSEILIEILQNHQVVLYENIGPNIGVEYHGDLLKAIKRKEGKIAAMIMRRHIEATIEEYKKRRNQ